MNSSTSLSSVERAYIGIGLAQGLLKLASVEDK